jgi:hypothetical protein
MYGLFNGLCAFVVRRSGDLALTGIFFGMEYGLMDSAVRDSFGYGIVQAVEERRPFLFMVDFFQSVIMLTS